MFRLLSNVARLFVVRLFFVGCLCCCVLIDGDYIVKNNNQMNIDSY